MTAGARWSEDEVIRCLNATGWYGRSFSCKKWLKGIERSPVAAEPRASVIVRHTDRTEPYRGFALLKESGIPIQTILVASESAASSDDAADTSLTVVDATPRYTALNLATLLADASLLIFLDENFQPAPGLLPAYWQCFQDGRVLAARGRLDVPFFDDLRQQALGCFSLPETTLYWPLDLDANMAVRTETFRRYGGFDETVNGFSGLDLSIHLYGASLDIREQRYVHDAVLTSRARDVSNSPLLRLLSDDYAGWQSLNAKYKTYLPLYGKHWQEELEGLSHE